MIVLPPHCFGRDGKEGPLSPSESFSPFLLAMEAKASVFFFSYENVVISLFPVTAAKDDPEFALSPRVECFSPDAPSLAR